MDARALLAEAYDLGPILSVRDMSKSSGCYLIEASAQLFVLKHAGRIDFVAVYDKARRVLSEAGLCQARVIPTRDGQLMLPNGYSLLEYIPGDAPDQYDVDQFRSILRYLAEYNRALRRVPFAPAELVAVGVWDRIKSTAFLCDNLESVADRCGLVGEQRSLLKTAGSLLSSNNDRLNGTAKQLIHADVGPGNIIFADGAVKTIIDFTPDYEHDLYALAHFLYWTRLWAAPKPPQLGELEAALAIYSEQSGGSPECDIQLLFAYLVKACLFRIMGAALNALEASPATIPRLERRIAALAALFAAFGVTC